MRECLDVSVVCVDTGTLVYTAKKKLPYSWLVVMQDQDGGKVLVWERSFLGTLPPATEAAKETKNEKVAEEAENEVDS